MKVIILGDTHIGNRNDLSALLDAQEIFFRDVLFPYMKENNLKTILQLGDLYDRRKFVNFMSQHRAEKFFFDPMKDAGYEMIMLVGNHDVYHKSTNTPNSPTILLEKYDNIIVHDSPKDINIDGRSIAILPWICSGNYEESMNFIENTKSSVLLGHLELAGFEMYRGAMNDHGFSSDLFNKFDTVLSGHFHTRSTRGNITYVGTPYEMTWSDYNDPKGFHVFDTETLDLTFVRNPNSMFHKLHYDDSSKDLDTILDFDTTYLQGSYIKVIVHNKINPYWFDLYTDKIEKCGIVDIQIIEDSLNLDIDDPDELIDEAEDTLTILRKSAAQIESNKVNSKKLDMFLTSLYEEAMHSES